MKVSFVRQKLFSIMRSHLSINNWYPCYQRSGVLSYVYNLISPVKDLGYLVLCWVPWPICSWVLFGMRDKYSVSFFYKFPFNLINSICWCYPFSSKIFIYLANLGNVCLYVNHQFDFTDETLQCYTNLKSGMVIDSAILSLFRIIFVILGILFLHMWFNFTKKICKELHWYLHMDYTESTDCCDRMVIYTNNSINGGDGNFIFWCFLQLFW